MIQLPQFFKDDSTSDKYEELIDFFMSWTLRCADDKYSEAGLVNTYSRFILSKLLFDDELYLKGQSVQNVKIWKQWNKIDLRCEATINDKNYALIIENKMYARIRPNQLEDYKVLAEKHYHDFDTEIRYVLLRPDYEFETKYDERSSCVEKGYQYYNIDQLQELLEGKAMTGNHLFDEFWFNW